MNLIRIPEAALILGLDRTTVWRWVEEGKLKPAADMTKTYGKRRQLLFDRAYIEDVARKNSVGLQATGAGQ